MVLKWFPYVNYPFYSERRCLSHLAKQTIEMCEIHPGEQATCYRRVTIASALLTLNAHFNAQKIVN